jgi:hypothetical protein
VHVKLIDRQLQPATGIIRGGTENIPDEILKKEKFRAI